MRKNLKLKRLTFTAFTAFLSVALIFEGALFPVFAQESGPRPTADVSGRVIDAMSGDPMIGVNVLIREQRIFASTDINGRYTLKDVPLGTHKVIFQMMGYSTSQEEFNVKTGAKNTLNISMSFRTTRELVVAAKRVTNTEAALLSIRKKAATAQDAISSEQISKSPDSDAADAAKRVTGVTIFGGKYIFVRGLDERYSGILVNGAQVPSPMPNKRVVPLNIFPASIIDSLVVTKTHSPFMPADFGGGIITVNTRDFPDEESIKTGISIGYNSNTTFKDFYTYEGGKLDYLGYDDGTYALPDKIKNSYDPIVPYSGITDTGYSIDERKALRKEFSEIYSLDTKTAPPSGKISISYGNTINIDEDNGKKLGLLLAFAQKIGFSTQEGKYKQFATSVPEADYSYKESKMKTNTTGQIVAAYSFNTLNELKLTSFYTHFSEKTGREKKGQLGASTLGYSDILKMVYTDLLYNQIMGRHYINFIDSQFEYFVTYSYANRDQPDTRVNKRNDNNEIFKKESLERFYNSYNEYAYEVSPWITIPFTQWGGIKAKTRLGFDMSSRVRGNESRRIQYDISDADVGLVDNTGSFDTLYAGNYYYIKETTGTTQASGFDSYDAELNIISGYGLIDLPLMRELRLVAGVRIESWKQRIDSFNKFDSSNKLESDIGDTEYVPSANLVYSVTDDINIRTAYSQTINRPDFIEASKFRYYDDIRGVSVEGNPDLDKATINNGDVRFEVYPDVGEIIALSGFYKEIKNPIEASIIDIGGEQLHTYYNQEKAVNYGAEFEIRKNFGFISKVLKSFTFFGNFTYVISEIELDSATGTQELEENRPLQGQSPWVINTGLNYDNKESGTSGSVLFNMFGRRITQVSTIADVGNIYEESYPKVDLSLSQKIGTVEIKLTVENLLDPEIKRTQDVAGKEVTVLTYHDGISSSLGITSKF